MHLNIGEIKNNNQLYLPVPGKIIDIIELTATENLYQIRLADGRPLNHLPGQFIGLSIFGKGEAPISISSSPTRGPEFEIIVRKMGSLTSELHLKRPGDIIGIRGPFGNGFDIDKLKGSKMLLIAGGLGIAPLRSLINFIIDNKKDYGHLTILYGNRTPADIILKDEISRWKMDDITLKITVDSCNNDIWNGNIGLITDLIPELYIDQNNTYTIIVGPPVMYKSVIVELDKKNLPHSKIFLSLERYMKCGVGKCGHCMIENLYCCTDGPVFCYDNIKNILEAL
ncbi:MAG: FAD/NAD(P)-binding protein [Cyanobacteriota bacterium]